MVGLVDLVIMVMRRMIRSFESGFFCLFFRSSFLCVSDGDSGISDVIWWFTRSRGGSGGDGPSWGSGLERG
jgi:hypothetical protein